MLGQYGISDNARTRLRVLPDIFRVRGASTSEQMDGRFCVILTQSQPYAAGYKLPVDFRDLGRSIGFPAPCIEVSLFLPGNALVVDPALQPAPRSLISHDASIELAGGKTQSKAFPDR